MKKLLMVSAVLLCGVNVVEGILPKNRSPFVAAIKSATDKDGAIAAVKVILGHDDRSALDYSWVTSSVKDAAKSKGVTEAEFSDLLGLYYADPASISKQTVKDAIANVKVAADALQQELDKANKANDPDFWSIKQGAQDALAQLNGLILSPRPK